MWFDFFIGIAWGVLFLCLPATLVIRATGQSYAKSLALSPALSLGVYSLLAFLFYYLEIPCSWVSLLVPFLGFAIVVLACKKLLLHRRGKVTQSAKSEPSSEGWKMLLAYVVVGLLITTYVFIKPVNGIASFFQQVDSAFHLGRSTTFVSSGVWASINAGSFYPSGWHTVVAAIAEAAGSEIPVATNSATVVFIAFVFTSGMFFLIRSIFPENKRAQWCGSLCSLLFLSFPWLLLVWGTVYPYLASLCLLPSLAAAFIDLTRVGQKGKRKIALVVVFALQLVGLVCTNACTVFVAVMLLAPYCVSELLARKAPAQRSLRIAVAVLFALAVVAIWTLCYNLPLFAGTVNFDWPAREGHLKALIDIALLSPFGVPVQWVMAFAVFIGFIKSLRTKGYRWLAVSYLLMAAACFFDASTEGFLKHFLSGFWYTDQHRSAANLALFALPLAALGLSCVYGWIESLIGRKAKTANPSSVPKFLLPAVLSCMLLVVVLFPSFKLPGNVVVDTPFGHIRAVIHDGFTIAPGKAVYDAPEMEFVKEVEQIVGEGEKVANIPKDGSAFAAMLSSMSFFDTSGLISIAPESSRVGIVRLGLKDYVSNDQVREVVVDANIKYVLQLDAYPEENNDSTTLYSSGLSPWDGIASIDEDTPGFELVLQEGDMKLFRLTEV